MKDGKQNSFAFMLLESGFDVYLANSRGNRYSRDHVILKPKEPEFWKWSWQGKGLKRTDEKIDQIIRLAYSWSRDLFNLCK